MKNSLVNKKILITAGPTWVPLDDVRVISNISSGELGVLLAKTAEDCSLKVDLFLGPSGPLYSPDNIHVRRFKYFDDFVSLVHRQLEMKKYDIILHCAAVSDYIARRTPGKISSLSKELVLKLIQAPKIIDRIRRLNPKAFLVMFKLESGVPIRSLIKRTQEAMRKHKVDLAVANMFTKKGYLGLIVDESHVLAKAVSRKQLAKKLFEVLKQRIH